MRKILKYLVLGLLGLILLLVLSTTLVINLHPAFGKSPDEDSRQLFLSTGHYKEGQFVNLMETSMDMSFAKMREVLGDYIEGIPNQQPAEALPVHHPTLEEVNNNADSLAEVIWFGHSAFLLKINGQNILLDPMFGESPAPLTFLGSSRFSDGLPIDISELPEIDMVIFSHDHYDHLDYPTLKLLEDKVNRLVVPLGIGSHLKHWGFNEDKINEYDWWETARFEDIQITCAPARHFSGRGIFDRNSTLWASWIIKTDQLNIYFSGDGGYGPHFKEIGDRLGPFDFAMMECGQYNENWDQIHMMPEETAQAAVDLQAKTFMPIHWGSFVLSLHSWNDPVKRVSAAAKSLDQPIVTPRIGEIVDLKSPLADNNDWWKEIN